MKVLFDYHFPFAFAHGGAAGQIMSTKASLERRGQNVEFLRWWDAEQSAALIHYFGRPSDGYIDFAHRKGLKVVVGDLLGSLGARSPMHRAVQRMVMAGAKAILPATFLDRMGWRGFREADACLALTSWEAHLMTTMFGLQSDRVHVVPNGVDSVFFEPCDVARGEPLLLVATIRPLKRIVETCRAAIVARVPIRVVGMPYAESDPYYIEFRKLVETHPGVILYQGAVTDRRQLRRLYAEARGFVLLSEYESLSLAALEAAACGCPLLLADLPWARAHFGDNVAWGPVADGGSATIRALRAFHESAPGRSAPAKPLSWDEVAVRLAQIYEGCLQERASSV